MPYIENIDDYTYPSTAHMYGQSFLCISVQAKEVDKIGLQLVYNEPHIYAFKISDNLRFVFILAKIMYTNIL